MSSYTILAAVTAAFVLGTTCGWIAWRSHVARLFARRTQGLRHELAERDHREAALHSLNGELNALRIELESANAQLRQLVTIDALTGIANRRAFDEALAREVRRAGRERRELSLILCDIDGFKAYNDTYGHAKGDETLRQVARVVALTFRRAGDLAARYGGEEFAVILPGVAAREALLYAERLRRNLWRQAIGHERAPVGARISLSAGIASVGHGVAATAEALIEAADDALYRAKSAGRNQVALAKQDRSGGRAIVRTG